MSTDENKNESPKKDILYSSKDIKVYSDSGGAAEAEAIYIANQAPLERIRETVQLILRVFPLQQKSELKNKIYFDNP